MKNEMIDTLKELIRSYDLCNDPDSPIIREISMWRYRFLSEEKEDIVKFTFLAVPSENLMNTTPEEFLADLKRIH